MRLLLQFGVARIDEGIVQRSVTMLQLLLDVLQHDCSSFIADITHVTCIH